MLEPISVWNDLKAGLKRIRARITEADRLEAPTWAPFFRHARRRADAAGRSCSCFHAFANARRPLGLMLMLLSYTCSTPHLPAPATEPVRDIQTVLVKQLCGRASVYFVCSIHTVCPTHFPSHLKSTPLSVGVIGTLSIWPTSIVYDIFPKLYSTHILEAYYTSTFAVKTLNTLVVSSPASSLAQICLVWLHRRLRLEDVLSQNRLRS
jgi:hypothetical protein